MKKTFAAVIFAMAAVVAGLCGMKLAIGHPLEQKASAYLFEYANQQYYKGQTAFFSTLCGEAVVAVDEAGNIWRADSPETPLQITGTRIDFEASTGWLPSHQEFFDGFNDYIAASPNGSICAILGKTSVYYSTDQGKTWRSKTFQEEKAKARTPVTITWGNGFFAFETFSVQSNKYSFDIFKLSTDGSLEHVDTPTWATGAREPDLGFSFNDGYFFHVDRTSSSATVYYSTDLRTWSSFKPPVENQNPYAFKIGNKWYVSIAADLYMADDPSAVWTKALNFDKGHIYKAVSYNNGAIFITASDVALYADAGADGLSNFRPAGGAGNSLTGSWWAGANTISVSDKFFMTGCSNVQYGLMQQNANACPAFFFYQKMTNTHRVVFKTWNDAILANFEVADGELAKAPQEPTRAGYKFVGWDYDLNEPVTRDLEIHAQWEAIKIHVQFLDWNGTLLKELDKPYGSTLEAEDFPANPQRDGYIFDKWNSNPDQQLLRDVTFYASYTQNVKLTFVYPKPTSKLGLLGQFEKTEQGTFEIEYMVGDVIKDSLEYKRFFDEVIKAWLEDFSADGDFDFDVRFDAWDTDLDSLPKVITENMTVTAKATKLALVRADYYSQLIFPAGDEYTTFVGSMKVERMVAPGYIFNPEDFKFAGVDYEKFNPTKSLFYDNLEGFKFNGWDYDAKTPIEESITIHALYDLPTVHVQMYDAEDYLFRETDKQIEFLSVEELMALPESALDTFREVLRNFFLFRWNKIADIVEDKIAFSNYLKSVKNHHTAECQILTAFVSINTNNPDIYGGIFGEASSNVSSPALSYFSGTSSRANLTYFVQPAVFSSTLFDMNVTLKYGTALDKSLKTAKTWLSSIGGFFTGIWSGIKKGWNWFIDRWWIWLIIAVVVVLLVVFIKHGKQIFGSRRGGSKRKNKK